MKVKDILDRVVTLYHDLDYRRNTPQQYLSFLDDAILEVINLRPDSHEKRTIVKLQPGARQTLPDEAITLIDVYANMRYLEEFDEFIDGKPVYQVARKDLDYLSNWYTRVEDRYDIDEFAYDIRNPKRYWTNPPVSPRTSVYVEIGYSYPHQTFADLDSTLYPFSVIKDMEINLDDTYRNALVNFVMYRVFSIDVTAERDVQIGGQYLQAFYQSMNFDLTSSLLASSRIWEPAAEGIGLHNNTPSTRQSVKV